MCFLSFVEPSYIIYFCFKISLGNRIKSKRAEQWVDKCHEEKERGNLPIPNPLSSFLLLRFSGGGGGGVLG